MTGEIEQIRSLVANSEYKDAINALSSLPLGEIEQNELLLLESRLSYLDKQNIRGILDHDKLIIETNKIGVNILTFISSIEANGKHDELPLRSNTALIDSSQIDQLINGQKLSLRYFMLLTIISLILSITLICIGFFSGNNLIRTILICGGVLMLLACFIAFKQIINNLEKINVFSILMIQLEKALLVESNTGEIEKINDLIWKKIEQSILN
ncbi:MAG: hypothetical protein R2828_34305 [Saprospiraceae bacterium]